MRTIAPAMAPCTWQREGSKAKNHTHQLRSATKLPHHTARGRAPRETRHGGRGGGTRCAGAGKRGADGKGKEQRQPELMDSGNGRRTQLKAKAKGRTTIYSFGYEEVEPTCRLGTPWIHHAVYEPGALHDTRPEAKGEEVALVATPAARATPKKGRRARGQSSPLCRQCPFTAVHTAKPNQRPSHTLHRGCGKQGAELKRHGS